MIVWVYFSGNKVGPLIPCDVGAVNSERYIQILEDGIVTFMDELLQPELDTETITVATLDTFLFMHDNAPCHKAIRVTKYLKR